MNESRLMQVSSAGPNVRPSASSSAMCKFDWELFLSARLSSQIQSLNKDILRKVIQSPPFLFLYPTENRQHPRTLSSNKMQKLIAPRKKRAKRVNKLKSALRRIAMITRKSRPHTRLVNTAFSAGPKVVDFVSGGKGRRSPFFHLQLFFKYWLKRKLLPYV